MKRLLVLGLLLTGLAVAGCAGRQVLTPPTRQLVLSVLPLPPAALPSNTVVTVTARPEPEAALAWVSGTVKLRGAPVLPMRPAADGKSWSFRTMVPPMTVVPAGTYEVRAWGQTQAGESIEGVMRYEVK